MTDWRDVRTFATELKFVLEPALRLLRAGGELVRLTLDDALVAQPTSLIRFGEGRGVPVLDGRHILELKFRHQPPSVFKRLVEEFALTASPASKYRLSVAALGAARLAALPSPAVSIAAAPDGTTVHA